MKKLLLLCLWGFPLILGSCSEDKKAETVPSPAEVDVAMPLTHTITEWEEFTGRFEAIDRVNIRARVTGYLVEKKFRDGQIVKKGDVLFVIDPRSFEYEMQRAQAQYTQALNDYNRAKNLRETRTISQEDFDARLQELKVAEATLNEARLDLEFTNVTAPLDGKISDAFVDTGNLVRENDTVLTRIVSVNPIHFEFEAPQDVLLKYMRLDRSGERESSDTAANPIFIKLQDEERYIHKGRMDFVDNVVDAGTGTIQGRAVIENKKALIYPGLFGRALLIGRADVKAIVLPEQAINTDQNRKFVYTVDAENKVQRSYITPGRILDNGMVIIEKGLKEDDPVVINGIQRIRAPEQVVFPVETTLEWVDMDTIPDAKTVPDMNDIMGITARKGDINPAASAVSSAAQAE